MGMCTNSGPAAQFPIQCARYHEQIVGAHHKENLETSQNSLHNNLAVLVR